jgi:hypothetical protein
MQPLSRRGVALLATTAALGAGSLTTVAQAASAATISNTAVKTNRLIPIVDQLLINTALAALTANVPIADIVSALGLPLLDDLIAQANPTQLTRLLSGLDASQVTTAVTGLISGGQLAGVLGTATGAQTADLLGPLTGSTLATALGLLDTSKIIGALPFLNSTELPSVLSGLTNAQTGAVLGSLGSTGNLTQLSSVLGVLGGTSQLTNGLATLGLPAIGDLLAPLTGGNLTAVLGGLTSGQLGGVLGTLTPGELTGLLGTANPTQQTAIVGGLTNRASGLAAAPNVTDINGLLAQVQGLLGGGLSSAPGLSGLLDAVRPLLGVAGLDTSLLTGLLSTLSATAGSTLPEPLATAVQGLIGTTQTALAASGVVAPPAGTGATAKPLAKPATGTAAMAGQAAFRAYRATVGSLKVAKNRKTATMSVSCPATAPKGCLVTLDGLVAGRQAFTQKAVVVLRSVKQSVTVKLTSAAASRLKKKGGSLTVSAKTVNASLAAISKSVKVAKPVKKAARTR